LQSNKHLLKEMLFFWTWQSLRSGS